MTNSRMISTGRGGAGNLRLNQVDDDYHSNDTGLPQLQTKRFTTGRGGAGNMMDNIDPDSTRAAQDENDVPNFESTQLAPKQSMAVGRGGYGNQIKTTYSQSDEETPRKSICEKISSSF